MGKLSESGFLGFKDLQDWNVDSFLSFYCFQFCFKFLLIEFHPVHLFILKILILTVV